MAKTARAAPRPFTQADVDRTQTAKARPPKGGRIDHATGHSIYLTVHAEGHGRWWFGYRPRGVDQATGQRPPMRKVTIGTTETHSLGEARQEAAALRLRVAKGEDPAQADRAAAAEARAAAALRLRVAALAEAARVTCRMLLPNYAEVLAARGRSVKHVREETAQIRLGLDSIKLMDASPQDITMGHIERLIALCPAGSRALRFGALDRFLRHALRGSGTSTTAPTAGFARHEKPKLPPRRQHTLEAHELAEVWNAAGTLREATLRDLTRFLVSTPCRESEAAAMLWRDVNLPERIWTMPNSKNGLPHRFPLNDHALAILQTRRDAAGVGALREGLVFPAPRTAAIFNSWSRLKRSLDPRLEDRVRPWRIHDLRRSAATCLGEAGFDNGLIDLTLNHKAAGTRGGIAGTYNVSVRWPERIQAMRVWDLHIGRSLGEVLDEPTGATGTADVFAFPTPHRGAA
jgi:integrase